MEKLNEYVGTLKKVRIERSFTDACYINGFIHDMGLKLLVMQQFHDFYCEGYVILRLSDIINYRSNEYERFFEKVLEAEGLIDQITYDRFFSLDNIIDSISYFIKTESNIIIECETNEEDGEFYIGKAIEIDDSKLWFREFNALGKWEKSEIELNISDITQIQFDTPYIQIFSKYLSSSK